MRSARANGKLWTELSDIAAAARRRWASGAVLKAVAAGAEFEPIDVPLRGPRAGEIGDDLSAVRDWITRLSAYDGPRYTLTFAPIGGRVVGRNRIPTRAVIGSLDQLSALLGVDGDLRRFREILALVDSLAPVRAWVVVHPVRAVELAGDMAGLVAAYRWLDAHRGSGAYLREITAPAVDTKFAERHRAVLAAMLGVSASVGGFVEGLGLSARPRFVRLRLAPELRLAAGIGEMWLRADELARLPLEPRRVMLVENEVTYLAVPVPDGGAVIWGQGFAVDAAGDLPWLRDVPVNYWGDLDTHGFAILDRLRAHLPHARSVLMDEETLLQHRERWVVEDPTSRELPRLTAAEREVYTGLVTDAWGERVRLEQERIDWQWALERLA